MERWVVGIVIKNGYVLIGELANVETKIRSMKWFFPYIKISEEDSPRLAVKKLMHDIGLKVKISKYLLTSIPSENNRVEQIYYELNYIGGIPRTNAQFKKFLWVKPTQVFQYFTNMIDIRISDYLKILEKEGSGMKLF